MIAVLGATGRIGAGIVDELLAERLPVRAVIRDPAKADILAAKGASVAMRDPANLPGLTVAVADYYDGPALTAALNGADTVFLLTPENPAGEDFIKDAALLLHNYRKAIIENNIKRLIGLSSFGAQHSSGTGNLLASHMLEQSFTGLDIEQTFIRPTYYYSNWMGYYELVRKQGVLPTFFPPDMQLPMIAPADVAAFAASILSRRIAARRVMEIVGPKTYSANEIAAAFGDFLGRKVSAAWIPPDQWLSTLRAAGFSPSGAENLAQMTAATISKKTKAQGKVTVTTTTFPDYLAGLTL